jgi:hypothetical protein
MFAKTDRLMLRPAWSEDEPMLAAMLHDGDIANGILTPAPGDSVLASDLLVFQRTARAPRLIGSIGLRRMPHGTEFGLWIARPYWGLGFATEAGRAAVSMAIESLRLGRLVASHLTDRPAAGRVLRKLGFVRAGQDAARVRYRLERSNAGGLAA